MALPTDLKPIINEITDIIQDDSLALKTANNAFILRELFQAATLSMAFATSDLSRDEKTGEKIIDVDPEIEEYSLRLAIMNLIGLPADLIFGSFMNLAINGNTKAIAQDPGA